MAYKPGIFQYGTIGADSGGYDDYGFGTDEIFTLPPFKVNENTGNDGTDLNNTFNDPTIGSLYDAGLTGGNIFTGGSSGGGGGAGTVTAGAGGYTDPVNQDLFNRGLVGPAGDSANLAANPNYKDASSGAGVTPASGAVILPPVNVNETNLPAAGGYIDPVNQGLFNRGLIDPAGDAANIGDVVTASSGAVTLPPVVVPGSRIPNNGIDPSSVLRLIQQGYNPANTFTDEIVTMSPVVVTPAPTVIPNNGIDPAGILRLIQQGLVPANTFTDEIVTMPPVNVTPGPTVRITVPSVSLPPVTVSNFSPNVTYPPITSSVVPTTTAPVSTVSVTASVPFDPNSINSGVGTYGTNAQTLTTKRDFGKELEETLAALQKNQSGIMGMYGDLYKQFMPKGITDTESSVIDQYKTDLARLQQRQAGVLAPEDIRQSQQAAREAYGARGQVMGRGAVGAEIMGRENIRQQREDQARAGMQASYGNIMNMANLQTGNIFSPIGNLMSNTFNPLSPYAADVYGTNVNAQLAKEIAQKNYDAAVRSAELSGAAQKSAATTSAAGNILGPAIGGVIGKGLGAIFTSGASLALSCMPGDQCIDTPTGPKAIKDLKGGDSVIGYDGEVAFIAQACSWNQNPLRTFLTITREDGSSFTVCDDHKIMGIPAMEWVEGAELAGSLIKSIEETTGLLTSYDILTNQGGYRINGIPVNSMIPEIVMQVVEFHRQVDRNLQAIST